MERIRRIGWVGCLILISVLTIAGVKPGMAAFRQAMGVRGLLQASVDLSNDELANPFVCMRDTVNSAQVQVALENISDGYLRGVGLCMAGEGEAGLAALREAGGQSNAEVQYAAGLSTKDSQAGVDALARLDITDDELIGALQTLSTQPGIQPYPALRALAKRANTQPLTWRLWLDRSSRLEAINDWLAALDWIEEGMSIAPPEVRSSLYLRAGRIYQTQSVPRDYPAALAAYNQAIQQDGWLDPNEEAYAHIYRGEIYRSLKDEFSPEQALAEFFQALELQPGSYWALMSIGHVYLYDLKELDGAESYYRQALETDVQAPYAYYYLGEVYLARGDKGTAVEWINKALQRQPNWQPALERLKALEGQ